MENPSKSEVIGRCGGDEKNEWSRRTDKSRTQKKKKELIMVGTKIAVQTVLFSLLKVHSNVQQTDDIFTATNVKAV